MPIVKLEIVKENNEIKPKLITPDNKILGKDLPGITYTVIKYDLENNYCLIEVSEEDYKRLKELGII